MSKKFFVDIDVNAVVNLALPVEAGDAANKAYVDLLASGSTVADHNDWGLVTGIVGTNNDWGGLL